MWGRKCPYEILLIFAHIFKASCIGTSSLTFVIDDTGSMADDIYEVKRSANRLLDIVFHAKSSVIDNMVLVSINDPHSTVRANTKNQSIFRHELDALRAHNIINRDCPEPSMKGVLLALDESHPSSYIFVFTDASAKDSHLSEQVKEICQRKQSQIFFVITDYCYYLKDLNIYYDIAAACSGFAVRAEKKSLEPVIKTIAEFINGNKSVMVTKKLPPRVYNKIPFIIDDCTEYAIVSVSGNALSLKILGPTHTIHKLIWNENGKVVKLTNATAGEYIAVVRGTAYVSVVIVGRTDFLFTHGFSELVPKTMADTTPQPIANEDVYLSISINDPKHLVNIKSVHILGMDEKKIKTLQLKEMSTDFYITKPFVAPSQKFRIEVEGIIISTGKTIKRISKIPTTPQKRIIVKPKGMKPVTTIVEGQKTEVEYDSTLKLTCKVSAYPEPKISWKDSKGTTVKSLSSILQVPNDYISYVTISNITEVDQYACYAENQIGRDFKSIKVVVKDAFVVKSVPKGITGVFYGSEGTITCDITSAHQMNIRWYYADEIIGDTNGKIFSSDKYWISADGKQLKIKEMNLNLAGRYTCKATLKNYKDVQKSFSTTVSAEGVEAPKVSGVAEKKVRSGTSDTIKCTVVKGVPIPKIAWQFKRESATKYEPLIESNEIKIDSRLASVNVLKILNLADKHAGSYKCVAVNDLGTNEHVTTLIVESPPKIISKTSLYNGVEGDLALRIPCTTTGIPKPTITWKVDGAVITPNDKYAIEDEALIIYSPNRKDSNQSYACEAKNYLGSDSAVFPAQIDEFISFGATEIVNIKIGENRKLECEGYNSKSQLVTWVKEYEVLELNEPFVYIEKATVSHDGNYTCRVNDKHGNTYTHTYVVKVGYQPKFNYDYQQTIDWRADVSNVFSMCDSYANPLQNVTWYFNGKLLTDEELKHLGDHFKWGRYSCNVSNVHGSIQRSFEVASTECYINKLIKYSEDMPLFLNNDLGWPSWKTLNNHSLLQPHETLKAFCPSQEKEANEFQTFNKEMLQATCVKQDIFAIDGKNYRLSDLHCKNKVRPYIINKKTKCLTDTSELIRVGYQVKDFLETYDVCFDHDKHVPLYTRTLLTGADDLPKTSYLWHKYPAISDERLDKGIMCKDSSSSCCYARTLLEDDRNFNERPARESTFVKPLNTILYWRPCNNTMTTWEKINEMVRTQINGFGKFVAWSGTHTLQESGGAYIPRYLWKVLKFDKENTLAIVHVNDRSPTDKDIKCNNICTDDEQSWFTSEDKFTYCCGLDEFLVAFNLKGHNIGE